MPKEKRWYYRRGEQQEGPFLAREIRHRVRTGEIAPTDLLWKPGMPQWMPAGSFPKLFKQVGKRRRLGPSVGLLATTGLLLVVAVVSSPLGDMAGEFQILPRLLSIAFSGLSFAGAMVTLLLALVRREQEPMFTPTEGRLLSPDETDIQGADERTPRSHTESSATSRGRASLFGPISWQTLLTNLLSAVRVMPPRFEKKGIGPTRLMQGALVVLATGVVVTHLLSQEPRGIVVAGRVTFQGKPVRIGVIKFTPHGQDESAMPVLAGEIRDGRYALRSGNGCQSGRFTVLILGFTGIQRRIGAVMDPLGDPLFPRITRTVDLECPNLTLDIECDRD